MDSLIAMAVFGIARMIGTSTPSCERICAIVAPETIETTVCRAGSITVRISARSPLSCWGVTATKMRSALRNGTGIVRSGGEPFFDERFEVRCMAACEDDPVVREQTCGDDAPGDGTSDVACPENGDAHVGDVHVVPFIRRLIGEGSL